MIITYYIECFERTLHIIFPMGYTRIADEIIEMLDEYYTYWNNVEDIEDLEEQQAVHDACLEEYMMDRLSETYNMWERWWSTDNSEEEDE